MAYTREVLQGFSSALLSLAEGGRPEELALRFVPHLARLFSAHVSSVNVVVDGVPIPKVLPTPTLSLSAAQQEAFPDLAMDNPCIRFLAAGGRAPVLRIADFVTDRQFRQTGIYRDFFRHFGGEQQMSLLVSIPGEQWGFVLFRDRAFTDEEAYLFSQFEAHAARALIQAKGLGAAGGAHGRRELGGNGVHGFAVLDPDGTLCHVSEEAARLMIKYFGANGAGSGGQGRLPEDLARWVGVTLRLLRRLGVNSVPGRNLVVSAVGGVLEAGLLMDAVTGAPFLQLRERGAGHDYERLRQVGLTKRECEVLFWVAQGKRDGEIAVVLGAATKTVGKHVENILAKLGVETRTAAVRVAVELLRL